MLLGADHLVPVMAYVLVRAALPMVPSEVAFIEPFEDDPQLLLGPLGYALATIHAALNVIASVAPPLEPRSPIPPLSPLPPADVVLAAAYAVASRESSAPSGRRCAPAVAASAAALVALAPPPPAMARPPRRRRLQHVDGARHDAMPAAEPRRLSAVAVAVGASRDLALSQLVRRGAARSRRPPPPKDEIRRLAAAAGWNGGGSPATPPQRRRYSRGSAPTPLRATSAEAVDGAGEVADDEAVAVLATLCVSEAQIVHVRAYSPPIEADVEAAAADADGGGDGDAAGEAGRSRLGCRRAIRRRAAAGGAAWRRR